MYTRQEFEDMRVKRAQEMRDDKNLSSMALETLVKGDHYNWIHQTNWFGEPLLQLPQDMFAVQDIIFRTRPKYIIEVGTAWGGSLLFYSTLMEILGGEKIIGIDIYIPDDLKQRIGSFEKLSKRIQWINGSSVEPKTVDQVKSIIGSSREVMVLLDSFHTHEHVLKELQAYSPLVGKGHYLICGDTIIETIPEQTHRPRPWGRGNNPKTALDEFMKSNDRFVVDEQLENKLLLTCHPGEYLKCVKD